jgi:general secretion pathway protein B
MSILLEALKKSEAQRQLGKTPSIHSPGSEPPDNRFGSQQWIPLTLMAVSAVAMAWIGWQQYRPPPGLEDGAALAQARSDVRVDAAADGAGLPAEGDSGQTADQPADAVVARRPGLSLRTPVESYRAEAKSEQGVTVPSPADVQDEEREMAQASRSVSSFKADSGAAATAGAASGVPAGRPDVSEPAARDLPRAEAEAQARPSRAETHVTEPISYWELPQGVRDTLPEMRITVLVYAERPQDRFLLVSGQRMVEKDQLEGGVVLEEIRRDGAVFQYRTYRFLLKG